MKIGKVNLQNSYFLAPIAGFNDFSFRLQCFKYGASLCYTDMTSVNGIIQDNKTTNDMCYIHPKEGKVNLQLFGSTPNNFKLAIEQIENTQKNLPVMYDLNSGCPVPKITRQVAGGGLMRRPNQIEKILTQMTSATNRPITLKIRLGLDNEQINYLQIARMAQDVGVAAIALHARTLDQGYSGIANWSHIKNLKENIDIPVIGNGDVRDKVLADKMQAETGCDFVMVGRRAMSDPQIFSELNGKCIENSFELKQEIFKEYLDNLKNPSLGQIKMHGVQFIKGTPDNKEIKNKIVKSKSIEEVKKIILDN